MSDRQKNHCSVSGSLEDNKTSDYLLTYLLTLSRECPEGLPWELLYADDLVIIAKTLDELENRYTAWKKSIESKGLRINIGKTKV